jgi:PAS domain S-box-containing protein
VQARPPNPDAERSLRETEERYRLLVDSVRDYAVFQLDKGGKIDSWNVGAERLLGWSESEVLGSDGSIVFVPEDVAAGEHVKEIETAREKGRAEDERWHRRKDGSRFFASGVLTSVCDDKGELRGFTKVMRDVTERKEQAERLQRALDEKTVLLREIHHRVKNNLQVIVSLLSIQAIHSQDPAVAGAFQETESRVRAIARIHERLYASDDLSEVEFGAYLTHLVRELLDLHAAKSSMLDPDLQVEDMVLSIEQAIPLGLIANELILNSLKHGLHEQPGRLAITLTYEPSPSEEREEGLLDERRGRLTVRDTGPGLPGNVVPEQASCMGLHLVGLLLRQLHGRLDVLPGPGAHLAITFPLGPER